MAATSGVTTANEDRALSLLGNGTLAAQTASALGVSESYISQLLSREDFSQKVISLKCEALEKHNIRDNAYDSLEDKVLTQIEANLGMIFDPMKLVRILQVANAAKRRGAGADSNISQTTTSISLSLPTVVVERFSANVHNQVIEAGNQQLVTMQVGTLIDQLRNRSKQNESARITIDGTKEFGI